MKILRYIVAVGVGACLLSGGSVYAQRSVATYSKEAMENLVPLLAKAANDQFTMEPSTSTMYGGWLPKGNKTGNEKWISMLVMRSLDPNKQYRLIAAGDNDIRDLDIRVLDPNGKVIAEDVGVSRLAEITFRPTREQDYTIQMRVYDSVDNGICIGAIMKK